MAQGRGFRRSAYLGKTFFVGKGVVQKPKCTRNSIRCAGEASCGLEYVDEDEDAHWAQGDPGHWRLSVCLPSVSTSEHWREWGGRAEGTGRRGRRVQKGHRNLGRASATVCNQERCTAPVTLRDTHGVIAKL